MLAWIARRLRRYVCRAIGHRFTGPPHDVFTVGDCGSLHYRVGDPIYLTGREGEHRVVAIIGRDCIGVDQCLRCGR